MGLYFYIQYYSTLVPGGVESSEILDAISPIPGLKPAIGGSVALANADIENYKHSCHEDEWWHIKLFLWEPKLKAGKFAGVSLVFFTNIFGLYKVLKKSFCWIHLNIRIIRKTRWQTDEKLNVTSFESYLSSIPSTSCTRFALGYPTYLRNFNLRIQL